MRVPVGRKCEPSRSAATCRLHRRPASPKFQHVFDASDLIVGTYVEMWCAVTDYMPEGLSGTRSRSRARCCRAVGVVMMSNVGIAASFGWTQLLTMVARSCSRV